MALGLPRIINLGLTLSTFKKTFGKKNLSSVFIKKNKLTIEFEKNNQSRTNVKKKKKFSLEFFVLSK